MFTGILCYNGQADKVYHHPTGPNQTIEHWRFKSMAIPEFTTEELQTEEWRDVVGYEDIYSVSSLGRVRRDLTVRKHKAGKILKPCTSGRYSSVTLCYQGKQKTFNVHQLVAAAFIGECPEGMEVNHKKQPKTNNRISNLEYITHIQNIRLAVKEGLTATGDRHYSRTHPEKLARGDHHGQSKIKNCDTPRIFELRASGLTLHKIGAIFGVSHTQIWRVLRAQKANHISQGGA
jgi:hypothetical protein